jgi:hypothetical protein
VAGNDAVLTLPTSGTADTGLLAVNKDLVVDTHIDPPVITGISEDKGEADGVTSDTTLSFTGTAEAGATVRLYKDGSDTSITATATDGTYTLDYTSTTLAEGTYTFTTKATDPAGNLSTASAGFVVTVDTTLPSATITRARYEETWDGTTTTRALTLTGTAFDTLLSSGESSGTNIKNRLDWSKLVWDTKADDNTTANITFAVADITSAQVTNNTTLVIVPTAEKAAALNSNTQYDQLEISSGFLRDQATNTSTASLTSNLQASDRVLTLNLPASTSTPPLSGADQVIINQTGTGIIDFSNIKAVTDIQINTLTSGNTLTLNALPSTVTSIINSGSGILKTTLTTQNTAVIDGSGNDEITLAQTGSGVQFDLLGNAGTDTYIFTRTPAGSININDFTRGEDKLKFTGFTGLVPGETRIGTPGSGTPAANQAHGQLLYNFDTGILYFDADGTGTGNPVQIVLLGINTSLDAGDIIV